MSKNPMFVSLAAMPAFGASLTRNGGFEPPVATNACFTFDNPPFPLCGAVPGWMGDFEVDDDPAVGGSVSGPSQAPIPDGVQWAIVFDGDSLTHIMNVAQAVSAGTRRTE